MYSITLAPLITATIFLFGVFGILARRRLPDAFLSDNLCDLLRSVVGLTSTLSALVLGLLVASSFGAYNTQKSELETLAARAVQLDRILLRYGSATEPGRAILRTALIANYGRYSGVGVGGSDDAAVDDVENNSQQFAVFLNGLEPDTEARKRLLARAFEMAASIGDLRDLMSLQIATSVSPLIILTVWASVLFFGLGFLAELSTTALAGLAVGAIVWGAPSF
jgi:hypothetical protein